MSKCIKCGNEILTGDIHWEMGLCNNCYNELYKDHKTHISLDKMWLELAQSFRDENEKLQDKIADLEAKLAESEEKCEELKQAISKCTAELPPNVAFDIANDDIRYSIVCNLTDRNQEHRNTIKQLKQQLAEKDEELNNLSQICLICNKYQENEKLRGQLAEKEEELHSVKVGEEFALKCCDEANKLLALQVAGQHQDKISFAVEQLEKVKEKIKGYEKIYIDNQIEGLKKDIE